MKPASPAHDSKLNEDVVLPSLPPVFMDLYSPHVRNAWELQMRAYAREAVMLDRTARVIDSSQLNNDQLPGHPIEKVDVVMPPPQNDLNTTSTAAVRAPAEQSVQKIMGDLLRVAESQICTHEETHRGGAIWEICDACGAKWADDRGGRPADEVTPAIKAARNWLDGSGGATQSATLADAPEIARIEDFGVYLDDGMHRGWVKDIYGFVMLMSEQNARNMCINTYYNPHRVRFVAYDLGPRMDTTPTTREEASTNAQEAQ